jgi:hypothetical protein
MQDTPNVWRSQGLRFSEEYVEQILRGKKVASVRSNVRGIKVGSIKPFTSRGKRFAKARILEVTPIRFRQLTEEDAKRDGFDKVEQLLEGLRQFYKKLKPDSRLYIVRFEVVEKI